MRVLVTGSSGFLGAAVVRELLARGDAVIGFDTHAGSAGCSYGGLVQVTGDIADTKQVARAFATHVPDAVIHCAAIVSVLSSVDTPIRIVRVNIEGSLNVFEAMRLAGVRRCIHISSEEAYGSFRADRIDETHPLDPVMPYGVCKTAVEQF